MSQNRWEDVAESAAGEVWTARITAPVRYLEVDRSDTASSGGDLLVVLDGHPPKVPCDPLDPSLYPDIDVVVRDQERIVFDTGVEAWSNLVVRIVESQGKPFQARVRSDTEPIGNHREGLIDAQLVDADVVAFSPPIAHLNPLEVDVAGAAAVQVPLIAGNGLAFKNRHATAVLWVGDDNTVAQGNGFPLDPDDSVGFGVGELKPGAQVWLRYDTGTVATAVRVVRPGA